jgi:cleavage and polyadenylation specificity factor subunit 1
MCSIPIVGFCSSLDRDIPYSPSFILDLPIQVDPNLRNIIDFVFIPGFNNPTLAVLFQTQHTWTGQVALALDRWTER